jgi:hypothetical protein
MGVRSAFLYNVRSLYRHKILNKTAASSQNKQHQLTHQQLSLIVTGQVNKLTYEPNHRSL